MTISNNYDISQSGMKENESFNDAFDQCGASKGYKSKQSEITNTTLFAIREVPDREDVIQQSALTRSDANINLKKVAQPGKGGFLSAIKNFFVGLFQPKLQMPETVTVWVANQRIHVNGERFRGMIEALPMTERGGAAGDLDERIMDRVSNGEFLLRQVLTGERSENASTQEVSDMMLYIQLRHEALHPNESFTNGVYSIEDPQGLLAHFLDSCNEGYNRTSSHLEGLQSASLGDNEQNAMRGIDIPGGVETGLLDKRGTIHYGSIPQQENVEKSTRRLFIKTERHGCRLSLRSFKFWTKSFWVNTSGLAHRSMRFSDIGRAICNCFKKSEEKSGINNRSEKVPGLSAKDIVKTLKSISNVEKLENLKPYFSQNGEKRLAENARLSKTLNWLDDVEKIAKQNQGTERKFFHHPEGNKILLRAKEDNKKLLDTLASIKSKLMNGMYTDNPNDGDRNTEREFSWFLTSTNLDHPDRLGNEVMMNLTDLPRPGENNNLSGNILDADLSTRHHIKPEKQRKLQSLAHSSGISGDSIVDLSAK